MTQAEAYKTLSTYHRRRASDVKRAEANVSIYTFGVEQLERKIASAQAQGEDARQIATLYRILDRERQNLADWQNRLRRAQAGGARG